MGSRYKEKFFYVIDDNDCVFKLSEEYHYTWGCSYKTYVEVNGHEYERIDLVATDEVNIEGEQLPILIIDDLSSYFTANPTDDIKKAVSVAELSHLKLSKFLMIYIEGVYSGPHTALYYEVTNNGCLEHEYKINHEDNEDVEDIHKKILTEYTFKK